MSTTPIERDDTALLRILVTGQPLGTYRIVALALGLTPSDHHREAIKSLARAGVFNRYGDGTFALDPKRVGDLRLYLSARGDRAILDRFDAAWALRLLEST